LSDDFIPETASLSDAAPQHNPCPQGRLMPLWLILKPQISLLFMVMSGNCLTLFSCPAAAQRVEENVTTSAGDAFGKTIGNEKVGIYSTDDIRGFNPIDAGNARIEGLYFDQQDRPTPRLITGSTIRVGITAQGYPFPAPTGIVDYRLRAAGDKAEASVEVERTAYGGGAISFDASTPLFGEHAGLAAGAIVRRVVTPQAGTTIFNAVGTAVTAHPYAKADIVAFWSAIKAIGEDATPVIFPGGNFLPPEIERGRYFGQRWARRDGESRNYGILAKLPIGALRLDAGLFRSRKMTANIFADLLRGTRADGGVANRVVVADGDNLDDSISGELRLGREWSGNDFRHQLYGTLRGRAKDRNFGGQRSLSLGASTLNAPDFRTLPAFTLGANDQDRVRQITYGLGYGIEWARHGSLTISVSKSDYRKRVNFANPVLADLKIKDSPLLYSINGSLFLTQRLALYGGYVRGLEESLVAPEIAVNRGEAPPAILTRQIDAGLRLALTPRLSVVAGVFSVRKPYFNIDNSLRFGQLGSVENRGVELSLAGRVAPGVTAIAGTAFLDSSITGDAVTNGIIGRRPIGSVRRRSVFNLDWKPEGQTQWSFDLAVESFSSRIGNISNELIVPERSTFALGTRYRFRLGLVPTLLRLQATNIFNEYGWLVSGSGGFTYSPQRAVSLQITFDL
jgi:iron complex outermembrane recepter protein